MLAGNRSRTGAAREPAWTYRGDAAPARQLQSIAEARLHVACARCHHRRQRDAAVAPARLRARRRHRGACSAPACLSDAYLRGPADSQPVPPPAGRRRAQRRLRAAVAAHRSRSTASTARAASAQKCSAPMLLALGALARFCAWCSRRRSWTCSRPAFEPAASASCLAAEYLRICRALCRPRRPRRGRWPRRSTPKGRVGRRALGVVVFNVVLLLALADRWLWPDAAVGRRRRASGPSILAGAVRASPAPVRNSLRRSAARCCRPAASAAAMPLASLASVGRRAPLLRARGSRPDRRRHPATQADRRRDGRLVVAGGGVVALLCQSSL